MTKQAEAPGRSRLRDIPQDVLHRGQEMAGIGREVWLAGLGALATIDDDGVEIFDRLVERGKEVEARRRARLSKRREKVARAFEENVYDPLVGALQQAGVSTRAEVHELTGRVEALARQLDGLVVRLTGGESPFRDGGTAAAGRPRVFKVLARDDGWAIAREGRQRAVSVHATKDEALERARTLAHEKVPSRLEVYRKDGTVQESFEYGN